MELTQLTLPAARPSESDASLEIELRLLRSPEDISSLAAASGRPGLDVLLWQVAWFSRRAENAPLRMLVARDGPIVLGLVPLHEEKVRRLILSTRVLRLFGRAGRAGMTTIGPIFAAGAETRAGQALAEAMLRMTRFDVLQLADIEPGSPLFAPLAPAAKAQGARYVVERCQGAAYLELPDSWNAYLKSLSSERRARLRHRRAALRAAHRTRFFVSQDGGALGRQYCLETDGRLSAMIRAYRSRDTIFVVNVSAEASRPPLYPAGVLLEYAIEHAIDEGAQAFDFIACRQGGEEELGVPRRDSLRVTAFRRSIGATAYRAHEAYLGMRRRTE
jgi:CelD/BcsL family acetyltransferase involved in cellulose biosynthesis